MDCWAVSCALRNKDGARSAAAEGQGEGDMSLVRYLRETKNILGRKRGARGE